MENRCLENEDEREVYGGYGRRWDKRCSSEYLFYMIEALPHHLPLGIDCCRYWRAIGSGSKSLRHLNRGATDHFFTRRRCNMKCILHTAIFNLQSLSLWWSMTKSFQSSEIQLRKHNLWIGHVKQFISAAISCTLQCIIASLPLLQRCLSAGHVV